MADKLVVAATTSFALPALSARPTILTPRNLCENRGLDLQYVADGAIFIDRLLGYSILPGKYADIVKPRGQEFDKGLSSTNILLEISDEKKPQKPPYQNWHIRDLGGWPQQLTGREQRIAILDRGIQSGLDALPRRNDDEDYCSCNDVADSTKDLNGHGTRCAGVVAARVADGEVRRSVAPESQIIAAQVILADDPRYTTLAHVLLMLSWAIHRWDTRVVNMSFCAKMRNDGLYGVDVLGYVAQRLRRLDRALVFCAADEANEELKYPASAIGVVPVGPYYVHVDTLGDKQVKLRTGDLECVPAWSSKPDLIFGPGDSLTTVDTSGNPIDDFGEPSGACAFVSGVASLYMEAHPCLSVESILTKMLAEAREFPANDGRPEIWKAVRFPGIGRPSVFWSFLGRVLRTVRRAWLRLTIDMQGQGDNQRDGAG